MDEDGSEVYMCSDGTAWLIHGPDGSSEHPTLESAKQKLLEIREQGHRVPDHALEPVDREIADPVNAPKEYREALTRQIQEAIGQLETDSP